MTVDGLHTTYLDIPGRFFELNINYGVYVGGLGDFKELFLGNLKDFRGCIDQLYFNEVDIFENASREAKGIEGVTFGCSSEFDALSSDPISFVENDAFLTLPGFSNSRSGASLSFEVKTSSDVAIVFYNSGSPTHLSDFIAIEIINGRISLSANDGNGVVILQSDVLVSDGLWHQVDVQFSPSYLEVSVDGKSRNLRPSLGENKFFDLADSLYVGGLELNKQSFAFQQGLQSVLSEGTESSLKGCLRGIKINENPIGIREAEVTKGIKASGCHWEFPCLVGQPCIPQAGCYQEGLNQFRCLCVDNVCVNRNYSTLYNLHNQKTTVRTMSRAVTAAPDLLSSIAPQSTNSVTKVTTASVATAATAAVTTTLMSTITAEQADSPGSVPNSIRPNVNYLNIIITREHLIIAGVILFVVLTTVVLIAILIKTSSTKRASYQGSNVSENTDNSKHHQTDHFVNGSIMESDYDPYMMLMSNQRQMSLRMTPSISDMDHCMPPPATSPSVSTTCGSVVTDQGSRSDTPMKSYPLIHHRSGGGGHHLRSSEYPLEDNPDLRGESMFPLPPPSLYFGNESTSESAATPSSQWCTFHPNTLPSTKIGICSTTMTTTSHLGPEHNFCSHTTGVHVSTVNPSSTRILGDGNSTVGSPMPSLRRLPWSSDDLQRIYDR